MAHRPHIERAVAVTVTLDGRPLARRLLTEQATAQTLSLAIDGHRLAALMGSTLPASL